ncbi:type III-B CRISPR-associated protein Cas10/Cmr2 [Actinomadura sp. NPDC023710]|uniref:Cas10/Cmr2 second palm domain-containing protein n=1 Tax=Actinomadura sp. NPDC023710 TaxID=3158219 RepID=UPI0033C01C44
MQVALAAAVEGGRCCRRAPAIWIAQAQAASRERPTGSGVRCLSRGNGMSVVSDEDFGPQDLVIVTLPGVQRFVGESRRTADLFVSSRLMSELASALVGAVPDGRLILPLTGGPGGEDDPAGMPNRVVAVAPPGEGGGLARRMADAAREAWRAHDPQNEVTGFPDVQWVAVPPEADGYAGQWSRAQKLLAQRKRSRDFAFAPVAVQRVCTLTGRWPGTRAPGPGRRGEYLSKMGRIKRGYRGAERFPSTWSIASAPYRAGIIAAASESEGLRRAVEDLHDAAEMLRDDLRSGDAGQPVTVSWRGGDLPGIPRRDDPVLQWLRSVEGSWCEPATWDPEALRLDHGLSAEPDGDICGLGRSAAVDLRRAAERAAVAAPSAYLAVIAQDADHMGESLGRTDLGHALRGWHGKVSRALRAAGELQRDAVEAPDHLGRVVYAGGDDLLTLVPLAYAMKAARASYGAFQQALAHGLPDATASTAVVFFHVSSPLQSAVAAAQELLGEAKKHHRPGLGVTVMRRGGERATWISRWHTPSGGDVLEHLETLVDSMRGGALSARLAMGLERDRDELSTLNEEWLKMELTRRAVRHGVSEQGAAALPELMRTGHGGGPPSGAALVAQFLSAESDW